MPISHAYNFIFIHIPKCAGSSVRRALKSGGADFEFSGPATPEQEKKFGTLWLHHLTARDLRQELPAATWSRYFKFTFVRNPWDLLVSFYHFHKERLADPEFAARRPDVVRRFSENLTFDDWIRSRRLVRPSSCFVTDEKGQLLVDQVFRFESLAADFSRACQRIGIAPAIALPTINRSNHLAYRSYYGPRTREIVAEEFRSDIELFGYEF